MRTIVNKMNLPARLIAAFRSNFENTFDSTESVYSKRNEKYIKTKYLPKIVQRQCLFKAKIEDYIAILFKIYPL